MCARACVCVRERERESERERLLIEIAAVKRVVDRPTASKLVKILATKFLRFKMPNYFLNRGTHFTEFDPGTAGWRALTLPLCPSTTSVFYSNFLDVLLMILTSENQIETR